VINRLLFLQNIRLCGSGVGAVTNCLRFDAIVIALRCCQKVTFFVTFFRVLCDCGCLSRGLKTHGAIDGG
jgi:hypothetical protein